MKRITSLILLFLALVSAVLLFPPNAAGSSVFYISLIFLALAIFLSSFPRGVKEGLAYLRLLPEKRQIPFLLLWSAATFFSMVAITLLLSFILMQLGLLDTQPVEDKLLALPLLPAIAAFTLAPLSEEMLFRGWLFRWLGAFSLISRRGKTIAFIFSAILSSLIFASLHFAYGSFAELLVAFVVGAILCASVQKTGSLVPAIAAHAAFNFLSLSLTSLSLAVL